MTKETNQKSFEERKAEYMNAVLVDVSNGLGYLIHDADEFMSLLYNLLEKRKTRVPIAGIRADEDGHIKILMQGGKGALVAHVALLKAEGIDINEPKQLDRVLFTTSTEMMMKNPPTDQPFLELDTKEYGVINVVIGVGSDILGSKQLPHESAKQILETIYGNIKGVTIHVPQEWEQSS